MSDEWLVREHFNQMLLYVAFRARNAVRDPWDDEIPFPQPLRPHVKNLMRQSQAMCEQLAKSPGNFTPVRFALDQVATFVRNPRLASTLVHQTPWKVGDVVTWWVQAGLAVAAWRLAMRRDDTVPDESRAAATDETAADRRRESPESELMNLVVGRLRLADDGAWPPLWCADHVDLWRLTPPDESAWPATWSARGECATDYRTHLLDWCGDPHREGVPDIDLDGEADDVARWAIDYRERYQDFANACQRLLGKECSFSDSDDAAADAWDVYGLPGAPEGPIHVLRRPVRRASTPDAPPVARGWRTRPKLVPGRLIAQCSRQLERQRRTDGSIWRAITRAAAEWSIDAEVLGPIPPWTTAEAEAGDRGPGQDAGRLAALASLVAAVESWAEESAGLSGSAAIPAGRDGPALLRLVLASEGFRVRHAPGTDVMTSRLVPLGGAGCRAARAGTAGLVLERTDSPRVVEVGAFGAPARCPDDLLAAVEEFDWRSWALRTLEPSPVVDPLAAATGGIDWETTKRRLLDIEAGAPETARLLGDAFDDLHRRRLASAPAAGGRDAATAWLLEALEGLEGAICRLLISGESGVTTGLRPPRTPEGLISLPAWLDAPADAGPPGADWEVAWERSPLPFGVPCRETLREDGGCRVVFSAGTTASDDDLRLLAAPGVVDRLGPPWDAIAASFRKVLREALGTATFPDFAAAIRDTLAACDGEAATDFDRLVGCAVEGDRRGVAWVRLMQADARFTFACHPAVTMTANRLSLRRPEAGDALEWRDDDVAVDHDVEVRFATEATRSRRVLSRGRPAEGSAEACANRLVHAVRGGPAEVTAAALALQAATDRRRLFGTAATELAGAAVTVADALAATGIGMGEAAALACMELANWCRATGTSLTPDGWHPTTGVAAAGLDVERVDFHPLVPAGRVVVERFGVTASDGTSLTTPRLFVSAGPTPEGFTDVAVQAAALRDDDEAASRFRRCVEEFPRRALAGQAATAAPGLFDVAWKAVMSAPEQADRRDAAAAVQRFLDRSHEMVVFEPRMVTDYQESWLRGSDGRPPRGSRVERLLRPGLRTLDNRLVFPAIVETA